MGKLEEQGGMDSLEGKRREWLGAAVNMFRDHGAVSPATAKSPIELGLSPRAVAMVKRVATRFNVFVEVDGKYYLSEPRVQELKERRTKQSRPRRLQSSMATLRVIRLVLAIALIAVVMVNISLNSPELRLVFFGLLAIVLGLSVLQLIYLRQARSAWLID